MIPAAVLDALDTPDPTELDAVTVRLFTELITDLRRIEDSDGVDWLNFPAWFRRRWALLFEEETPMPDHPATRLDDIADAVRVASVQLHAGFEDHEVAGALEVALSSRGYAIGSVPPNFDALAETLDRAVAAWQHIDAEGGTATGRATAFLDTLDADAYRVLGISPRRAGRG